MKIKTILALLFVLPVTSPAAPEEDAALQRQETKQQNIQDATARASTQLAQLVNEFERNGISGQDVDILTAIQSVLGHLSKEQMADIVRLLKEARNGAPDATSTKVVSAFTSQKAVIVQLRQILLEYQRQLALNELGRRVRELGDRQSANLHEALALLTALERKNNRPNHDSARISVQLQGSEQTSLRDETGHILERLANLAANSGDGIENRPRLAVEFTTERKLAETLSAAAKELAGDKLMSAAGAEKSARDTLWQLADLLQSEKDTTEKLIEAAAELDELIAAEQDIIDKTEKLDQKTEVPGEEKLAFDERVKQAQQNSDQVAATGEENVARQEAQLETAKEQHAEEIAKAETALEEARKGTDQNAIRQKEQALQRATQQRDNQLGNLEQQVANQEKRAETAAANAQRNLDSALDQARRKLGLPTPAEAQEQAAFDVQKDQAETVDKTDFLKEQLEPIAAPAAAVLEKSIADMQEARAELGSDKPAAEKKPAALPSEQDALAKLEEARDAVLAQLEELQLASELGEFESESKTEQLEELLATVQDLKAKQEELQAKAEATENPAALAEQSAPQAALENQTRQAQQDAATIAPEASSDLNDAAEQMDAAAGLLAEKQTPSDEQQAAVDALAQAAEKIEDQLAALQAAAEELAAIDDILEKLNPIIEAQQNLQTDTNQQSAESDPNTAALAEQQSGLQEETSALAQEAAAETSIPEASESLGEAASDQGEAGEALAENQPGDAQQPQTEALADLNAAKDALEARRDELAEALGESSESPADFAAAQEAIAEAQEQVGEALGQLESPASAAQELAAQQEALAQAAAEPSAGASPEAQQATAAAAESLGEGDLPGAIGEMQEAQGALPQGGELASEQAEIQAAAEALAAAAEAAAAGEPLAAASDTISPLSSGAEGALPAGAEAALQAAQESLAQSTAQAASNSPAQAQASAQAAQQALAQAAAALTLAQAGLGAPAPPSQQASAQPGQPGQQPGQPGEQPGPPGQQPGPRGEPAPSNGDPSDITENQTNNEGERKKATGTSRFIGLPKRERGTLRQGSADAYPAEYSSMIEQSLKNLSDQTSGK